MNENTFESVVCETAAILSRPQCVKEHVIQGDMCKIPVNTFCSESIKTSHDICHATGGMVAFMQ